MKVTELKVGDILLPRESSLLTRLWALALGCEAQEAAIVVTVNKIDEWAIIMRAGAFDPVLDVIDGRIDQCHVLRPLCGPGLKEKVHLWLTREAGKSFAPGTLLLGRLGLPVDVRGRVGTMVDLIRAAYAHQGFDVAPDGNVHTTKASEWIF